MTYRELDPPAFLSALADDAYKWAEAFVELHGDKFSGDDLHGLMIGWFANAIEHSNDVRRWRREKLSLEHE